MNRSSIRKSFLDDLLGESDSSAGPAAATASLDTRQQQQQQRTKSVRFLDGDDGDDILGSLLTGSSSLPSSTSVVRGSHDTAAPGQGSRAASTSLEASRRQDAAAAASTAASPSDWLGLSEERPKSDPGRITGKVDQREEGDGFRMAMMPHKRAPVEEVGSGLPFSDIKIQEARKIDHRASQPVEPLRQEDGVRMPSAGAAAVDPVRRSSISSDATASSTFPVANVKASGSLTSSESTTQLLLQTQVKVLEIEKAHLSQMLDQCKLLHGQEVQMMTEMHQKQIDMTRTFLVSQEKMSIEEKDRRIAFLRDALDSIESERAQERDGYRMKLDQLIEDRDREILRIKDRYETMVNRMVEEHEKELEWCQRQREQEVAEVKLLSQVHESMHQLVQRWKMSTEEMKELQSIVTSRQEHMMNASVMEVQDRERSVATLVHKVDSFTSLRDQLSGLIEEQKDLLARERREMVQERQDWERDRKRMQQDLEEERREMRMQRESLDQELSKLHDQKLQVQKAQEVITRERLDVEEERRQVQQQTSRLHDLEARSHNLTTSQILLDQDKGRLLDLAQQVMRRAEELEVLTSIASRERDEGLAARERSETLLRDVEKKSAIVQEKLETVEEKERLLKDQIRFVESERLAVKEMKDRIVCSLCNSGLQSYGRLPDETSLLIWQMAGQRESALLAQEAAFLDHLRPPPKSSIG